MLGSIGRILRQVGIDVVILKGDYADHDECIKYSQKEDRVILTASKQLLINRVSLGLSSFIVSFKYPKLFPRSFLIHCQFLPLVPKARKARQHFPYQ
jgi:uncharacterized protein with PIN domain